MMKVWTSALLAPVVALVWSATAQAALRTKVVEYKQGNTVLEGYLAYDDAVTSKRPGVLVVHEWMGIGTHVKRRANQLARMGYVAFAPDIYGKGVRPKNPKAAGAEATKYRSNRALLRDRAQAGLNVLRQQPQVDPKQIAAIGYCFGGGAVLELARSGAELAGVVSFHGNLDTPNPADAKNIKAQVLVLHGGDDPLVPDEQVQSFKQEMRQGKVNWELVSYGGAVHSFTNSESGNDPSTGVAYNRTADRRSWEDMKQFFAEIFTPRS